MNEKAYPNNKDSIKFDWQCYIKLIPTNTHSYYVYRLKNKGETYGT